MDGKIQGRAVELLRMARERRELAGKGPIGLAAAALYTACQEMGVGVTRNQMADAAGVTEVTVRNHYKSLTRSLGLKLSKTHKGFKKREPLPVPSEA